MRSLLLLLLTMTMVTFVIGCADDPVVRDGNPDRIVISNNPGELNERVTTYQNIEMPLDDDGNVDQTEILNHNNNRSISEVDGVLSLMLRAEVTPPELDGIEMRATHVALHGNYAFVTYNREGDIYTGGLEVFDITDVENPIIVSQALFTDTDFSSVSYLDEVIYLAGATEDLLYSSPAILEIIEFAGGELAETSTRIDLPSFVATGVHAHSVAGGSNLIYVTSGAGGDPEGGLTIIDATSLEIIEQDEFDDARDVDYGNGNVVVMQGTPGRLRVYDALSTELVNSFDPGGANIVESKSTIDIVGDLVFMAAGDEGMKTVSASDGTIIYSLERINIEGIDQDLTVTNSVTVSNDLVLMGNGNAGVYVSCLSDQGLNHLGYMNFGTSANYVNADSNTIFVAAGTGGLKILEPVFTVPDPVNLPGVCDWDEDGVPLCLIEEGCDADIFSDAVEDLLEDRNDLPETNPELFDDENLINVVLTDSATVQICFIDDRTGWKNTYGYYTHPVDDPPTSVEDITDMTVIFPNASSTNGGGDLVQGSSMILGTFGPDTEICFFLVAKGWHAGALDEGNYTHFTDRDLNSEGLEDEFTQQHVLLYDEDNEVLIQSWEDVDVDHSGAHEDFNDVQLLITVDPVESLVTTGIQPL